MKRSRQLLPVAGEQALPFFILLGAVAGVLSGWIIGPPMASVYWLGEFFLNTLKMIIVPLIVTTMVVGVSALGDVRKIGRTGATTLAYYFTTTAIAVALGIFFVLLLEPGVGVDISDVEIPDRVKDKTGFKVSDLVLSFIWPNVFEAMAKMKLLPVILFSIAFGAIATTMGRKGKLLFEVFDAANDVMMKMVGFILWLAPIGIFGLIAGQIGREGGGEGILRILDTLGRYSLTVVLGLAAHAIIVLPAGLWFITGRSPLEFARGIWEALLSAFSTSSSSATMPITLRCLREHNKVREQAVDFVIPLGATVNMDGTALYESVAVIFIAQAWGVELSAFSFLLIFVTATLASIGAASIPQAGLVTMVMVLQAVDLPIEGIGLILAVDWLLDRFRTTVNVWGDSIGTAVVEEIAFKRG